VGDEHSVAESNWLRRRVLVADNEPGVHQLIAEVLQRHGLDVVVVGDGLDAVQRIEQGGIDLLVCDLMMPRMGGFEVLERLSMISTAPPVFVVSGHLDGSVEADLRRSPLVRGMRCKPFDLFAFAADIRALLSA
jgi:CheY-like chemotaxis protein